MNTIAILLMERVVEADTSKLCCPPASLKGARDSMYAVRWVARGELFAFPVMHIVEPDAVTATTETITTRLNTSTAAWCVGHRLLVEVEGT